MIKGIGIDSVEQDRISKIFYKYGEKFEKRILGSSERKEFDSKKNDHQKIRYLSNNFAAKEAFSKALGLGFREGVSAREIELLRNSRGKPYIKLKGSTKNIAERLNFKNVSVTVTDTSSLSTAFVIGE